MTPTLYTSKFQTQVKNVRKCKNESDLHIHLFIEKRLFLGVSFQLVIFLMKVFTAYFASSTNVVFLVNLYEEDNAPLSFVANTKL